VVVADNELHGVHAAILEALKELPPERLGLAELHASAKDALLAVRADTNCSKECTEHDCPVVADFCVAGIDDEIGDLADRPVPPSPQLLIKLSSRATDLGRCHLQPAQLLDDGGYLPGADAFKGGREWRAEAKDFPISSTMTGVILEMDPGALRELHWHPIADEWHYMLSGSIRATLFGSRGRYREATLGVGDVGYIPQGYGHSLENVGSAPAKILIVFNSGTYETIDVSQWIAGQPADVLAVNFGKPAALFEGFPKRDVFITKD